jgi:phosphatidylglycerol:prolipoprotein diacylglycerol transferase
MESVISIFGREIPLYGIFFYLGIAAAAVVAVFLRRRSEIEGLDIVGSGVYVMIGAVLGAKLLFLAVSADQIIRESIPLLSVIKGGFVFYGGLAGGALGLFIYVKQYRMKLSRFADLYTTVLPLGHAFGRVGCFFAGCCYGIPWEHGYVYHRTFGTTPIGIPLLPVQLIEAGTLLLLFAVQLLLFLRKKCAWQNTVVYFLAYPTVRFILEFFRGDSERGGLFGLSTSQWLSLLIICGLIIIIAFHRRKSKKRTQNR